MISTMNSSSPSEPAHWPLFSLQGLRNYLNQIEIRDPKIARLICQLVPPSCPFERKIKLWGKTLLAIPPLCHLNPFYDELMVLRFRALNLLSEMKLEY